MLGAHELLDHFRCDTKHEGEVGQAHHELDVFEQLHGRAGKAPVEVIHEHDNFGRVVRRPRGIAQFLERIEVQALVQRRFTGQFLIPVNHVLAREIELRAC